MNTDNVISLLTLFIPLALSIAGAAVRICGKLEKISVVLGNMVSRDECLLNRHECPVFRSFDYRRIAAARKSPESAARFR